MKRKQMKWKRRSKEDGKLTGQFASALIVY
jgi:hypothetical protein